MQTKIVKTVAVGTVVSIALASVAFTPAALAVGASATEPAGQSTSRVAQIHTNPQLVTLPEPVAEVAQVAGSRM